MSDTTPAVQTEARPFPALALRAIALLEDDYERQVNEIVVEAAEAVGVRAEDGWITDYQRRRFVRTMPSGEPAP